MIRRFLVLFALLLLPAVSAAFDDTAHHPYQADIDVLFSYGIVEGYGDGSYRPDQTVNRAEFLKVLMLAVYGREPSAGTSLCFADFVGVPQWYWVPACIAKFREILTGYPDGTFRGGNTVNLAEALAMSMRAWKVPLPQYFRAPDHWYDPYIATATSRGILTHLLLDNPAHLVTRGEMAAIIVGMGEPIIGDTLAPSQCGGDDCPVPMCGNGVIERGEECDDGNRTLGDGCSDLCIVVPEPIRHGALRIEQRPTGASQAGGGGAAVLLSFDALAGRQNIELTVLKFKAAVGNLDAAEDYRLYADQNRDGVPETLVASAVPQSGILTFGVFRTLVEDGYYKRFEVRAQFRQSTAPATFGLMFATNDPRYVQAIDTVDGRDLSGIETDNTPCTEASICWIAVYTQSAHTFTIGERGDLFVTKGNEFGSRQLLGGIATGPLFAVDFFAQGESIEVTRLRLGTWTDSIDRLDLYMEGASSPFATARAGDCESSNGALLCADTSFVIPKDQEETIFIHAVASTDTQGATSGDTVAPTLSSSTTTDIAVEARGLSSQMDLSQNDSDTIADGEVFIGRTIAGSNNAITGSTSDVVLAKITGIANVHADADDSAIPVGTSSIATFRFSAASHSNSDGGLNRAQIRTLVFTVSATNVQVDAGSFRLYNAKDAGNTVGCTANGSTGTITVTCSGLESSSVTTDIDPGSFVDLSLRVDVTNPQISAGGSSTLQVSLNQLGNRNALGTVVWDDDVTVFSWVETSESAVRSTRYRSN